MRTIGFLLLTAVSLATHATLNLEPTVATEPVGEDPDDPALWIHPQDASRSLIIATDKTAAPAGALFVYGLDGKIRQKIAGLDRPNNVDVEYGLRLGAQQADIAVATERYRRRLRVYRIAPDGSGLTELAPGGLPVFEGQTGEAAAPMGIALYKRPRDGAVFAIVGRKTGPREGYLWQYRLEHDGAGGLRLIKVREFGRFSGRGEIEAIAVDDELGYVYYADEGDGIHKWHADPDHPDAARPLAHFGREGFRGDREGIAIYTQRGGKGFIVCTDQVPGHSEYRIYRREGAPGRPHDHSQLVAVLRGGADSTDGIEVSSRRFGDRFPTGLLIAMNSSGKNFLIFPFPKL
ncbi:MAG: phytase [Bryobacterales bacterium]|nr:phytase [Bryobacteraceae bacterium]MDW8353681.1 phytase [Bryobacterales bacterium]